jgi:hypothetical protein
LFQAPQDVLAHMRLDADAVGVEHALADCFPVHLRPPSREFQWSDHAGVVPARVMQITIR